MDDCSPVYHLVTQQPLKLSLLSSAGREKSTGQGAVAVLCRGSYCVGHVSQTLVLLSTLRPFNGLFSRTTCVSQHQEGKPFWILLEQEIYGVVVASAGPYANHLHVAPDRYPCEYLTTQVSARRMFFLLPNQQHQSTGGRLWYLHLSLTLTQPYLCRKETLNSNQATNRPPPKCLMC